MKFRDHSLLGAIVAILCLFLHFVGGLESKSAFTFWVMIQFIGSVAILASGNETSERANAPHLAIHESAPPAHDQERAWQILQRIEDRLGRLESSKASPSVSPSPELTEIKQLQEKTLAEFTSALKAIDVSRQLAAPPSVALGDDKLDELSGALSEAIKEISKRDSLIDNLAANVSRTNIQRILIRVTQSLEVTRALQQRVTNGRSSAAESFDFLVDDLNSALADHGVESTDIAVGTRVADLDAGSFATISVVDAPEETLRSTVKEVRSRAYFIPEEGKKPRYIAPAKVILYRA